MAPKSTRRSTIGLPSWLLIFGLLMWLTISVLCITTTTVHPDLKDKLPTDYRNRKLIEKLVEMYKKHETEIRDAYGPRLEEQVHLHGKVYTHTNYDKIMDRARTVTNAEFDSPNNVLQQFRALFDEAMKVKYIGPKEGKHWCFSYWIIKMNSVIRDILNMAEIDPHNFYSKLTKRHFAALEEMTVYIGSGRLVRFADHFVVEAAMGNGEYSKHTAFHTYLKISFETDPDAEYLVIKMRSFDSTEACRAGEMFPLWDNKNTTTNTKVPDMIQFIRNIPKAYYKPLLSPEVLNFFYLFDREGSVRGLPFGNHDIFKRGEFIAKPRVRSVLPARKRGPSTSWVNGLNSLTFEYERQYATLSLNINYRPPGESNERRINIKVATTLPTHIDFQFPNWIQSTNLKYTLEYFGKTILYDKPELREAFRKRMNVFFFNLIQRRGSFANPQGRTFFADVIRPLIGEIYIIPYELGWEGDDLLMGIESLRKVHAAVEQDLWVKTLRKNKELCRRESAPPLAGKDEVLIRPIPPRFISLRPVAERDVAEVAEANPGQAAGDAGAEVGPSTSAKRKSRKCPFCPLWFPTSDHYSAHVGTHYGQTLYYDPVCQTFFASASSYSHHRRKLPHHALSYGAGQPDRPVAVRANAEFRCLQEYCDGQFFEWDLPNVRDHYKSIHERTITITKDNRANFVEETRLILAPESVREIYVCEQKSCCFSSEVNNDPAHPHNNQLKPWSEIRLETNYKSLNLRRWSCRVCANGNKGWCGASSLPDLANHLEEVHGIVGANRDIFTQQDVEMYYRDRFPRLDYSRSHFVCIFHRVMGLSPEIDYGGQKVRDVAMHVHSKKWVINTLIKHH